MNLKPIATVLLGLVLCLSASGQTYVRIAPNDKPNSPSNTGTVVCVGGVVNCANDDYVIPFGEIVADITHYCKNVVIATDEDANKGKVDYVLKVEYDSSFSGGTSVMLFDRTGHVAYIKKTRHIHNAFKDMCKDYLGKKRKP
jgi:3-dehydroquinate synthase class II